MSPQASVPAGPGGSSMSRRCLLGLALAAAIFGPLTGAGAARADSGTSTGGGADGQPAGEEYEIPEGIGSTPWW